MTRKYFVLLATGLVITVATGIVYGRLSQRWGPVPDLVGAARHLESMPNAFGDWEMTDETPIDETIVDILSCAGYVNRDYVNQETGEVVHLAILVGPSGPISVHTPEICYSSLAYAIRDQRQRTALADDDGQLHTFWKLSFRSDDASLDQLRVYYAWTLDGRWTASDSPRFEFAGRGRLFKLQMAAQIPIIEASETKDPCKRLLVALLRSGWRVDDQSETEDAAEMNPPR